MARTTAVIATENGWKYIQQLCKHWAHKLQVDLDEEAQRGVVTFDHAVATMQADASSLKVFIDSSDEAGLETYKGVVASHLDRFAFREAPLPFDWKVA
ncbi:DUF2218 domain-containing protein [Peteryoungia ipomoeae]|uniref:DUF2218 domain-containing protein n=1 Tax=Peteryoungia ipomoeae TaxID=1210932 RepID=A0A4S8P685_9HYPH|nr:DUF2218 domain-containing protein [Peteryoungia ipomoeae]THV25763.1 DUF2218 domain-containing protein [Peteryoungia ipomoeae]